MMQGENSLLIPTKVTAGKFPIVWMTRPIHSWIINRAVYLGNRLIFSRYKSRCGSFLFFLFFPRHGTHAPIPAHPA